MARVEKNKPRKAGYEKKYRGIRKELLHKLKAAPCTDCGQCFPPCVMDFDHVKGVKLNTMSHLLNASMETFMEEVSKCELVCANCHRIRTHILRENARWGSSAPRRAE